jgi:hypothetical protein
MEIEYRGRNCVAIKNKKTLLVVDPTTDISVKEDKNLDTAILMTNGDVAHDSGKIFTIDMPGEYEHNDISVKGIAAHSHADEAGKNSTMYRIESGDIRIAIIGHTDAPLSDEDLEELGIIDIVIIPVGGGGYTLDARDAATIIKQISPKIVVPTHFADPKIKYEVAQDSIDDFIKSMGGSCEKTNALKIKGAGGLPESLTIYELERIA